MKIKVGEYYDKAKTAYEKELTKEQKAAFKNRYTENDIVRAIAKQSQKAQKAGINEDENYIVFQCDVELIGNCADCAYQIEMTIFDKYTRFYCIRVYCDENMKIDTQRDEMLVYIETFKRTFD